MVIYVTRSGAIFFLDSLSYLVIVLLKFFIIIVKYFSQVQQLLF